MKSDVSSKIYISPECRNERFPNTGILCSSTLESSNASISDLESGEYLDFGF